MARKRKRSLGAAAIVTLVFSTIVVFSLAVRWLGARAGVSGETRSFQIEVLNGTGEPRAGMAVANDLRLKGIDVLIVDNAERRDFARSILVDRRGDPRLMRRLAKTLGCRRVVEQIRDRSIVDATYVIGADRVPRRRRGGS